MSKISDLRYYMQSLASSIDDIEDTELKDKIIEEFNKVDNQIDDIESYLSSIKYDMGEIL